MSISITGLGTGLPIDTWIEKLVAVKQSQIDKISAKKATMTTSQSALSTVKNSYSSLLSSLQTLTDSNFGGSKDVFAQNTTTTSNANVVTATATSSAAKQAISVYVSQLATATTVKSTTSTSAFADSDTKISSLMNGNVTEGNFSVYVDNQKHTISVASTDTLGDVMERVNGLGIEGLEASVTDGKLTIKDTDGSSKITIGSSSDTSNFAIGMSLVKNEDGSYTSSKAIFEANTSASLTSADAGFKSLIQDSTFKIGNATFTVNSTTTLNGLISEINSNSDSGVNAYWDSTQGKLVLNSTKDGASNINIENISGNFTDVMGFTSSTYNGDGTVATSVLATDSQTLGKYAKVTINGTEIISASNTVTSDISGLAGVTLNLKAQSTGSTGTTNVNVTADSAKLKGALNSFISAFNTVIANTDEVTGSEGYLYGETSLRMIRDNLRTLATASSASGSSVYDSLATIGITTGAVGAGIADNTDKLVLDEAKFLAAFENDPATMKKLLLGDGTNQGIISKLKTQVEASLDSTNGYFAVRQTTFTDQLKDLSSSISKETDALAEYKKSLQLKFSVMDEVISKMQQQFNTMSSMLNINLNSSSSSSSKNS